MTMTDGDLEAALAALVTTAPPTLAERVLVEVGRVDTPHSTLRSARSSSPGTASGYPQWNPPRMPPRSSSPIARGPAVARFPSDRLPATLERALAKRLGGDRRVRLPLDLRGHTDFERDVWRKALDIPRGEVRPYSWIAAEIGRPKAVRAVGTALGHIRCPSSCPATGWSGRTGRSAEYSLGGPSNKRRILAAEGLDPDALETSARSGIRYVGSEHDPCRLPPDLPPRAADHAAAPRPVPVTDGCHRHGLSALPILSAGLGAIAA